MAWNQLNPFFTRTYTSEQVLEEKEGTEFENQEEHREELQKYLLFLSSSRVDRNIEILKRSGDKKGSGIAHEIDYDITSNHVGVLRNKYMRKGLLDEEKIMTPLTEEILDVFEEYR